MALRITAGKHKGRSLGVLGKDLIRPTTESLRQKVFDILQDQIIDAVCLDLFAGSGAVGFEALSRGAASVIFVEKSLPGVTSLHKNRELLQEQYATRILKQDVFAWLKKPYKKKFNFIYVDPPYEMLEISKTYKELLFLIDRAKILHPEGVLFFESGEKISPPTESGSIVLKDIRKAGSAILAEYRFKK